MSYSSNAQNTTNIHVKQFETQTLIQENDSSAITTWSVQTRIYAKATYCIKNHKENIFLPWTKIKDSLVSGHLFVLVKIPSPVFVTERKLIACLSIQPAKYM